MAGFGFWLHTKNSILFYRGKLGSSAAYKFMTIKKKKKKKKKKKNIYIYIYIYIYTPLNQGNHTHCWEGKRGPLFEILEYMSFRMTCFMRAHALREVMDYSRKCLVGSHEVTS